MDEEIPEYREEQEPPVPIEQEEQEYEKVVEKSATVEGANIKPELIELDKRKILPHVKPQKNKYWHFQLSEGNQAKLQKELETIPNYKLTATFGIPQNTADITLTQQNNIVGKIHFLLCDRRDANLPEKYYTKLFFFHFNDAALLNMVRNRLLNFFNALSAPRPNHNKRMSIKSIKRRNLSRRRRTNKNRAHRIR
jgi:hypothetical protein